MVVPAIVPTAITGAGPSRLRLRNRLADELGFYLPTAVTAQATNAEAARTILAAEVRDDEVGADFFGAPWVYVRDGAQAGTQRRILAQPEAGYQGPRGATVVSRPFDAALAAGTTVEYTSPLPVERHLAVKGLHQCIDEALGMIRVPVRLSLTGNGGYEYDLSATYSWLVDEAQIVGISDAVSGSGLPPLESPYAPTLVTNGVTRTLVTRISYGTDQTFYLDAVVPGDRLVYDGAAWGYVGVTGTPGLLDDTYQAAAPERWVLAFAMVKALQFLDRLIRTRNGVDPNDRAMALDDVRSRRQAWARAAALIQQREFPRPRARFMDSPVVARPVAVGA